MVKENPQIPDTFRKGKRRKLRTVSELITELEQLPGNLKLHGDFKPGVRLSVANVNDNYLAVCFNTE